MKYLKILTTTCIVFACTMVKSQEVNTLVKLVKEKLNKVNDYEANGSMKTNVTFLKVPEAIVKIYFKKPNKLKIKNEKGISFIPKGAVSINLNSLLSGEKFTIIDAGKDKSTAGVLRIVKLLPIDDNADIVLSTLYIDEANSVIKKVRTTTRENGSYELEMTYGKYIGYALPDKILFSFNTKDYKLPKGITFDFDDGSESKKTPGAAGKSKNGSAEIIFKSYIINKGVLDSNF